MKVSELEPRVVIRFLPQSFIEWNLNLFFYVAFPRVWKLRLISLACFCRKMTFWRQTLYLFSHRFEFGQNILKVHPIWQLFDAYGDNRLTICVNLVTLTLLRSIFDFTPQVKLNRIWDEFYRLHGYLPRPWPSNTIVYISLVCN